MATQGYGINERKRKKITREFQFEKQNTSCIPQLFKNTKSDSDRANTEGYSDRY